MKAQVWAGEQANRCGRCGTYTWEWQYQDEDGKWHDRKHVTRQADLWTCQGCAEVDELHDAVTGGGRQRAPHGLQVRWFPHPDLLEGKTDDR